MHLWVHGELHHKPGGIAQDEGCDQVPVDDVPQAPDAPGEGWNKAPSEQGHWGQYCLWS